jgi:hypothetical protein
LKGKTNFFNDAKIKMYETYLRKIHNKDKEIKLISERHIDENDINY